MSAADRRANQQDAHGGLVSGARHRAPFPDDSAPLYTVGQVADLLGVQAAFLRRLDAERVVSPARSPGGQRRYSRHEIDLIGAISQLMSEGMTLAGAQRIIELQQEIHSLREELESRRRRG